MANGRTTNDGSDDVVTWLLKLADQMFPGQPSSRFLDVERRARALGRDEALHPQEWPLRFA
jgi:hypothetical protein